ncbi:MAG: hypothetical protein J6X35_10585, partial [Bacteroidales bacterium]|nr:hypothetical protein [Bacteroidales bacterium]
MLNNKSNTYGLYLNQPTGLVIVNNSLYLRGSASTFYGMSFNNTNNNRDFVIRNNNVVIDSGVKATNAYPISMPSNTNLSHWDIDYNNWYSSRYMGNIGNIAIENLLDFQAALITPQHESNVFPDFNDKTDLHMRHTGTLTCPSFAEVALDKDGAIRMVLTNRGCYRGELDSANASLSALLDWPAKNTLVGDTLRPSVVMQNSGLLTLNSATIGWSVNGVQQPSIKWSGRLQTGMTGTIALGKYVCMNGSNGMAAYLEAIGTLKDAVAEDDTVKASNYSCDAALNGQYTVGANGRFATLNDAFFALEQCGLDGPVELLVTSGTQNNISIQGLFPGADSTHKVTVRSIAQHYDSVIVSGEIAMLLANTGHLRFEDISFAGNQVGVKMEDSVVDVVFHRCGISAAYSSSNTACCAVSYPGASNSYVLDDVHFIANTIQGGYYGISLQYAHSNNSVMPLTRGIYIDSNTVSGSYTGINVSNYCHVPSISHNTIRSIYTGISFSSYCIGKKVEGNRIYVQNTTAGGQATGISCGTFLNNTVDTTLFINNEIRVEGDGLCHGLNMTFLGVCHMEAHHNSVYVTSKSNAARGIYTIIPYLNQGQSSGNRITRNLLVTDGTSNYPFYIESQARMGPGQQSMIILPIGTGYTRREWNNLYSSTDVAYAGSVAKTIADLQAITNQDGNSISAPPASGPFPCPSMVEVTTDINGMTRDSSTYIGCYHRQIDSSDAALTGLLGVENICSMKSVPVQAVIRNDGYKSIDSAVITILIDSVKQAIVRYVPSQPLAYLQSDTVALGGYRLPNGPHEILAYVKMRNDSLSDNDTIRYIRTVCDSAFRGIYIVGNSKQADYTFGELDSLFARMNICGVSGDVTIAFENGSYSGVIDLSAIANAMEGHHLTLTSVSGNSRDAAIITGTSRTLTIGSSNKNVTVKNLALQNTGSGTVISLFDGCENINILHNWLLKDSINPSGNIIQKEFSSYQSTGIIRNINIIGNLIVGGNRGVYLDVNGGASSIYWSDGIVIDSNEMAGQYSSAIYVNHENVRSISHNKIRNLVTASGTYYSWHGIDLSQSQNDSIMGNEIDAFHANVANIYPMYLGGVNYYGSKGAALVANNAIRGVYYGVYCYGSTMDFYHNTIRLDVPGVAGYGFYDANSNLSTNSVVDMKGNIFDVPNTCWAVYLTNTTNPANPYRMDYNNYYTNGGSNLVTMPGGSFSNLSSLRNITGMDAHSVSCAVAYEKGTLKPQPNVTLVMPRQLATDIDGTLRHVNVTTMGAYQVALGKLDACLLDFANTKPVGGVSSAVSVTLMNTGFDTITTATIHWTFNGVVQTAVNWSGRLISGNQTTVALGSILPVSGSVNRIVAWVSDPNHVNDGISSNDTIEWRDYVCNGRLTAGT